MENVPPLFKFRYGYRRDHSRTQRTHRGRNRLQEAVRLRQYESQMKRHVSYWKLRGSRRTVGVPRLCLERGSHEPRQRLTTGFSNFQLGRVRCYVVITYDGDV